jgi:transposase-like protein
MINKESGKNQNKTLDEKVAIVLEMLKGKTPVEEICRRRQVSITDAYHWCALFLDGAKKAFKSGCSEEPITQEEIKKLKKIIGKE